MASPVSFGDAYLMGSLALRLGRAFTKGRKSAPTEFREVENQLYSLSAALCALKDANTSESASVSIEASRLPRVPEQRHVDGDDIISSMLRNCEETLKHLEALVDKYSCIGTPRNSEAPLFKRWSRDLKDNWKKIAWTTEGGDLATLRSQLTVHVNSLNLVLGVVVNSQANQLASRVDQIAIMLKEIHVWFVENLKGPPSTTQALVRGGGDPARSSLSDHMQFQLYAEAEQDLYLICSHACLHPKWNERHSRAEEGASMVQKQLFICRCSLGGDVGQPHSTRIATYGLSPLTFPVRLTDKERSWMLYKATDQTTNRLVSLIIKCVPPSRMAEFEETFIHPLSIIRTQTMLRRNMGTMLAYVSQGGGQVRSEARILNLMGDLNMIQKFVDTVTFSTDRHSYYRSSVEYIQLLHYKSLNSGYMLNDTALPMHALSCLASSEIVIFYASQEPRTEDEDIDRMILHLKYETKVTCNMDDFTVLLQGINCQGLSADEQKHLASGVDVKFRFTISEAAKKFHKKIEEMRMELFVMRLQYPQVNERPILKLQARHVHTEEIHISEASISILQNTSTQRLRLVIASLNGCSILSQELRESFLTQTPAGLRPNFASPTYLVQIGESGTREISKYAQGFRYLDFDDVQICRLFELGLATIANGPSLLAAEPT